ncbi:FdhF/YdeP family oxidoreductase [Cryobacterium sp. TMT2-17-1]|uniref:FdhF/YdeP family oxidoreductase n=1 Tax=unclassified Cryobacterium TaxID=2649013 RepID=UPI0010694FD1|nr:MULTISPECIES: FdhF/YdeP family oxidoreductase [unclassified Cryobacterium]TFB60873.1 FdhF/YdeP family oxidoreductase [Cryobacterium sp. Sr3]TFC36889.1 FdhF/YdeP family oxidoreductase [Cryobacterium sp. TMT2-14]TFC48369.1 FdhF/YdeP family oxidoreductase [Cryobacterium sp. TMT2-17-1]
MSSVDDIDEDKIEVGKPREWAAGVPGVTHALGPAFRQMGVPRSLKALTAMNQRDGFDCMSCAWPDPDRRKTFEFCENGAKAVTWEATPITIPAEFWAENPIRELLTKSEYWLGMQGRLVQPVHKPAGSEHYRPITWDDAFKLIGDTLRGLESPDQATFYTSGRTSNEAAFLYQLFVRALGTNNLPDCSNMCHESTSHAMAETVGIGKSTVTYADFARADLIIIMGQNPGSNHPRMLTALEEAKEAGAAIVAVNPLLEAGLMRYKNPQKVRGVVGAGTVMADQYLQIRLGGDMALMQALSRRVLDAEAARPGTVLDHAFLRENCVGLEELREHLAHQDDGAVLAATGLRAAEIDELADRYLRADRVIITWAMGITQHKKAVPTIREIINLLLLRGNIGKPGAGASPIRGHSNVQGDRTMGIWEKMPPAFLDALEREFGFDPPRVDGLDSVDSIRAMRDGLVTVWIALGGNLVGAISDTVVAEAAIQKTVLSVQISTKLNRSHAVVGDQALILPTLGRTEIDLQATGPQFVSVEDTVSAVHSSTGLLPPVSDQLLSEVAIVSRLARAALDGTASIDWAGFESDYDIIRDHISHVIPGFADFNQRIHQQEGFSLPHAPRDLRTFPTPSGKALLTVNELEPLERPPGRLLLQTLRSHDQFNTTIYSPNDRYRGIKNGRQVIFVNPEDVAELGLISGMLVDVHSEFSDNVDRVLRRFRLVAYPSARGCAAAYFPEANVLVPLDSTAEGSNTPVSKAVLVRLEPSR